MKFPEWAKLRDRALDISDGWWDWSHLVTSSSHPDMGDMDTVMAWQQQLMESHPKLCEGLMLARLEARQ